MINPDFMKTLRKDMLNGVKNDMCACKQKQQVQVRLVLEIQQTKSGALILDCIKTNIYRWNTC